MDNQLQNTQLNLEALSKMMPGVFLWKKNIDSIYSEVDTNCAELFGINNKRDISGLTDYEIPCKISEFAELFRQQDKQVIATGRPLKILEVHHCSKNQLKIMLNTKNPLRNEKNIIIGTFAYCIDITNDVGLVRNLFSSATPNQFSSKERKLVRGSYILSHDENAVSTKIDDKLTQRQLECLVYLAKGMTAKEIALCLKLSPRTIEYYLGLLKDRYNCHSKSQLIKIALSLEAVKEKIFL